MKAPHNIQPSFDDEISIADVINFFKFHKKIIIISVVIGAIFGGLFMNFAEPVYKGSVLISPAKISGTFVVNPKVTVTKLAMNSHYSKETFLNCNSDFYKDKDKDISSIAKASITKDGDLIEVSMQHKNKTVIKDCLNSVVNDCLIRQNIIASPRIQTLINELSLAEEKLKESEDFKNKLNARQIKELKKGSDLFSIDLLRMNMILLNSSEIRQNKADIKKLKLDLSLQETSLAEIVLPINIQKKSPPTPQLGALIGLFLGLCLGILIALIKQIKI